MENRVEWHYLPMKDEHMCRRYPNLQIPSLLNLGLRPSVRNNFQAGSRTSARNERRLILLRCDLGFGALEKLEAA